jgi:energy-coupling factor transporter ATP-binding protein EcfA2
MSVLASTQALALQRGGLLLHGAALVLDGQAVVVSGPSGAGKSTLAARFAGQVLHDDVIALAPDGHSPSGWAAWSQDGSRAPSGELPGQVPLQRLLLFSSDRSHTFCTPMLTAEALGELAAQTYFAGGMATARLMAQLAELAASVPLGRLGHCLSDSTATVQATLRGEG